MRKIIVFNRVSADGYFAPQNGSFDWTTPDDQLDRDAMSGGMAKVDTMLFGRRTYDAFESFWPHALDGDPHHGNRRSEAIAQMAEFINAMPKIVFSKSREAVSWNNSHLRRAIDPGEIEKMKSERGDGIIVFGSGSIVSQLTALGLVDEYLFVVNPILLGTGQHMIRDVSKWTKLELLAAKPYESGNVLLRYARRT